jgi:hypothetical protein
MQRMLGISMMLALVGTVHAQVILVKPCCTISTGSLVHDRHLVR